MKQLEVQIMGQSYLLACPENGDAPLLKAVQRVDQAMCKIRDAGKIKARDRIAVLAALNLAFDMTEKPSSLAPAAAHSSAQTAVLGDDAHPTQLNMLLARLDAVLSRDGQLL